MHTWESLPLRPLDWGLYLAFPGQVSTPLDLSPHSLSRPQQSRPGGRSPAPGLSPPPPGALLRNPTSQWISTSRVQWNPLISFTVNDSKFTGTFPQSQEGEAKLYYLCLMIIAPLDLVLQALPLASCTLQHGSCWKAPLDHILCPWPLPQAYLPKSSPCQGAHCWQLSLGTAHLPMFNP